MHVDNGRTLPVSFNGRTALFEGAYLGSNPGAGAKAASFSGRTLRF